MTKPKLEVARTLAEVEVEAEAEAEERIDWKRRFEQKITDAIETEAKYSRKLSDTQLELDKARKQIVSLEAMVRGAASAQEKLDAVIRAHADADMVWAAKLRERDEKIKKLNAAQGRGQRQVMEDVIAWIQARANNMPEPVREPEIELDPPTEAVF